MWAQAWGRHSNHLISRDSTNGMPLRSHEDLTDVPLCDRNGNTRYMCLHALRVCLYLIWSRLVSGDGFIYSTFLDAPKA